MAFLEHRPVFPGRCLLVPKEHFETLDDLPGGLVGPLFTNVQTPSRGEGTTLTIRLPINLADSGDATDEVRVSTPATAMRILVVDDEEAIRELLADYLTADGHTVETAADGREGLDRYRAGPFDLVLTDRAMPDMNGDQLADAIRNEKRDGYIIMLTGYGDSIRAEGELPDGVDLVLNKPVKRSELQQALTTVAG